MHLTLTLLLLPFLPYTSAAVLKKHCMPGATECPDKSGHYKDHGTFSTDSRWRQALSSLTSASKQETLAQIHRFPFTYSPYSFTEQAPQTVPLRGVKATTIDTISLFSE
jgi:hypothetical protein